MPGNDANTKFLLHGDGADASTTFTDASSAAHGSGTVSGNSQVDTAQSKFGGASILGDGAGDGITWADSADWDFGSGAFTIDCWIRQPSTKSASEFFIAQSAGATAGSSFLLKIGATNVVIAAVVQSNVGIEVTGTTSIAANTWYHVAFIRTGDTLKLFIDGTQEGGNVSFTGSVDNSTAVLGIGSLGSFTASLGFNGWVDEVRISKGIARWTTTFTPPTAAYDSVAGTLTADVGAFVLTGIAVFLNKGRLLAVDVGTFVLTGVAASLLCQRKVIAAVGDFTFTGVVALLKKGWTVTANAGSFTLTGITSALLKTWKLIASVGTFTLSGQLVALIALKTPLSAEAGSFVVTGTSATLSVGIDSEWHAETAVNTSWTPEDALA